MNIKEYIYSSLQTMKHSKLRSALTMLGIIIGIMSVIIVMSVGAGAQSLILNQVKSVGSNLVGVLPGGSEENAPPAFVMGIVVTTLKYEDGEEIIKHGCKCIEALNMYVSGNATFNKDDLVVNTTFSGVNESYLQVEDTEVSWGRFFTEEEEKSLARVVVLGNEVKERLFGDQDPLGSKIKIKKTNFTVIGVMKKRGVSGFQNQDDQVFVPLRTAQKLLLGIDHVSMIRAKVDTAENVDKAVESIEMILRDRHNIDPGEADDFKVSSMAQGLEMLSNITNALRYFLVLIAGIALVVGGFGIMNIMLATIQERTREIGLRKAVGAKSKDIIFQFLIEAVVITFFAGIIGIILGVLISILVAKIAQYLGYQWDLVISLQSILLGCGVSIGIGLIFGIFPARRASKLNAIESLRYE
ncbi:MAG TPA: ABC transporter permease [Candidatus Magasanikbacteria bacterium]|jgi:ABC-type antimicrobial peptide transport system permease subunit|nr:ABC transporter permease [Candidatus Magasanikbacteria bacterium]